MNTKLITALRVAANALENGTFDYDWYSPARCNCGVLACSLLGVAPPKLNQMLKQTDGYRFFLWADAVGRYCPITGMPKSKIFKSLLGFGLSPLDLVELETLENKRIRVRAGFPEEDRWYHFNDPMYKYSHDVAKYMRAWADLLVEDGRLDSPSVEPVKELVEKSERE